MAYQTPQAYPRPDFERNALRWISLNGPWDFLFDDDDAGLAEGWHNHGLPAEAAVTSALDNLEQSNNHGVTQNIAAGTQDLLENNALARDPAVAVNKKCQIQVPFVFQCPASGINDRGLHEVLWYERRLSDPRTADEKRDGYRLLLRFGAVDYLASVWIDGVQVGVHQGGHVPFEIDVTGVLGNIGAADTGEQNLHRLTVRVYDSAHDLTQPRGKQYWGAKPESIFYTPSSGIWQSVWLETVPAARIADSSNGTVIRSNDIKSGTVYCNIVVQGLQASQRCAIDVEASFNGVVVARSSKTEVNKETRSAKIDVNTRLSSEMISTLPNSVCQDAPLDNDRCWRDGVALWSPEHPQLYDLTIRLYDTLSGKILDQVNTYTGMRSIQWSDGSGLWKLNGKWYFQMLCLDQGYWPDTFMTAPSANSLKLDIQLAKNMGFNGCRKHQKVEDPVFYYWADKLGYLVWAEMANAYQFSQEYVERFNQEWVESVKLAINHPSVVTWTPVNESWGYPSLKDSVEQRNHIRALYYITKTLDSTRSINDNCGWEHVCTDLTTFHDYSDGAELEKTCDDSRRILAPKSGRNLFVEGIDGVDQGSSHVPGAPFMCTEFGGINIARAAGDTREWGHTTATDPQDLLSRIEKLVKGIAGGGLCCAFVYTQLTDVEQEANGLYTCDRKEKIEASKVKALMEETAELFYTIQWHLVNP